MAWVWRQIDLNEMGHGEWISEDVELEATGRLNLTDSWRWELHAGGVGSP